MKLKPCKTCGVEIAKSAKHCPHCGGRVTHSAEFVGQIIALIVIINIVTYLLVYFS